MFCFIHLGHKNAPSSLFVFFLSRISGCNISPMGETCFSYLICILFNTKQSVQFSERGRWESLLRSKMKPQMQLGWVISVFWLALTLIYSDNVSRPWTILSCIHNLLSKCVCPLSFAFGTFWETNPLKNKSISLLELPRQKHTSSSFSLDASEKKNIPQEKRKW